MREVTAQIFASDNAGNKTAQPWVMRLDTVPPWVSLTPPNVREFATGTCSGSFDPVGEGSPDDGEVVGDAPRFRALVWERGIKIPLAPEVYLSGVAARSVKLYVQPADPAIAQPLLLDLDGDSAHLCDTINVTPLPPLSRAPFISDFEPLQLGGSRPQAEPSFPAFEPIPPTGSCSAFTGAQPSTRCVDSEMRYILPHTAAGVGSVIYSHEPTTGTSVGCTGRSIQPSVGSGWLCVIAAARDNSGNLGVSKPLRVFRCRAEDDCAATPVGSVLPPPTNLTCTDGCTLPESWSTANGMGGTIFSPRQ